LFGSLCEIKEIDPGKPVISDFGKKLYHIGLPKLNNNWFQSVPNNLIPILGKKITFSITQTNNKDFVDLWKTNYYNFIKKINETQFSGIIFDYDGTLCKKNERIKGISDKIKDLLCNLLHCGLLVKLIDKKAILSIHGLEGDR
jgi:hypothetical protein